MKTTIPVVLCFDANYAPYAAVATFTLIQASRSPVHVHWLVPAADAEAAERLRAHVPTGETCVEVVPVQESRFAEWKETQHLSRGAYLRLLIPELLAPSRVLYLDCDTLVLEDLTVLYETPMAGCRFAGVVDPAGAESSRVPRAPGDPYINSGVLLMDLEGLREDGFWAQAEALYHAHQDTITWLDQCIINKYAEGRKQLLDPRWNRQVFSHTTHWRQWQALLAQRDTAVVHFVGGYKPWQAWCHPEIAAFWWSHAHRLDIPGLQPTPITTAQQAYAWADVLQLNDRVEQADEVRRQLHALWLAAAQR